MPIEAPAADPRPAQPLTNKVTPNPNQATEPMAMSTQEQQKPVAPEPQDTVQTPEDWGLKALGEPQSYREGVYLNVMVVAKMVAALSGGTGGFADQAAYAKATEMGLAGKPVITNSGNVFPVNHETLERCDQTYRGCWWGKYVQLTTRG